MKIAAGRYRGRNIEVPAGLGTRPTMSRVREAIFDMLRSMDVVEDATVLDLFSGSGGLGIEALSQGAASVTFVEQDAKPAAIIQKNLDKLKIEGAKVVRSDVLRFVERSDQFDLALIDPPFAFDEWSKLLGLLKADLAVMESDREVDVPEGWEIVKLRHYGGSVVTIAQAVVVDS